MVASAEPELIGRSAELTALDELLSAGAPRFAELVGEPGIGKTALLDALQSRAAARGFVVLRGRAAQFEQEIPFHAFVDALDDHLATMNPRRWTPLGPDTLGQLASVFPSLGATPVTLPSEERYRIHRAVRSLLGLLASAQPLALILDDAHWCDQASLELLRHLVRRPPRGPVLIAIAERMGIMPASWDAVAAAAMREGDLVRIEVGPLKREDADALLAGRVADPELRSRVFEATGGNPFFLRQVAEAPDVAAAQDAAARGRDGVPQAVLAAIREEVGALGERTQTVLRAAAIAGDPFDPALAAVAAAIPEAELLPHVDELERRGLVRVGDAARRLQFRHPIVWRGVYEDAPVGWRLAAHSRLAADLASRGAGATARAPHLAAAARPGDLEAVAALREAADLAAARAPASAASWYQAALWLLPEGDEERVSLLVAAAGALGSTGRLEQARDLLRDALALVPGHVEAVVALATMENLLRNLPEAKRLLTTALASLEDRESPEAATIMLALSTLGVFDYADAAVREWGRRALALAARLALRSIEAAAAAGLAYNEGRAGDVRASQALLDRAAAIVDREATDVPGVFWVAVSEMQVERFEASVRHGDRARDLARASDQGRWLPQIAVARAFALYFLGRVGEAAASIEEAIEMARLTRNRQFEAIACVGEALIATAAGDLREALAAGNRAIELSGPVAGGDHISLYARQNAAIAFLAAGDPHGCRRLMLETMTKPGVDPLWKPQGLVVLTEAELRLGDVAAADRYARTSLELADGFGLGMRRSWALQACAAVELARGQARRSAETAYGASEAAAAAMAPIEEARALTLAGRALAASGDAKAAEALQRAYELLEACGAAHFRDAAAGELRALGHRVVRHGRRRRTSHGPSALTDRERDVAELVAEGLTNREIAETLHVSEKTVEKNLANVFRKLGVSRRGAVGPRLTQK